MGHLLLKSNLQRLRVVLGLGLLLAAACATTGAGRRRSARVPVEEALAAAQTDLERGQILYERSCSRCHALYMPKSHTAGEWRYFVKKYGRKARLSKDRQLLVYGYLEKNADE